MHEKKKQGIGKTAYHPTTVEAETDPWDRLAANPPQVPGQKETVSNETKSIKQTKLKVDST